MTIALKITLKEDWKVNTPCVHVMAKTLRGKPYLVATLTPAQPEADVTILKDRDLYFELDPWTAGELERPK